jgi:hypothetical protein
VFELDEDGNPIKGTDKPQEIPTAVSGGLVVVEDDEGKAKREDEQRRLAERQMYVFDCRVLVLHFLTVPFAYARRSLQNALPQWHTHSTVSGDQTGLGLAHEERQARIASNGKGRANNEDIGSGQAGNEQDGKHGILLYTAEV